MNMTSSSGLFVTGDIYLIRKPIPGNYGIHKLFDMLVSSQFGIAYDLNTMPEIWLLTTNKRKKRLSIMSSALAMKISSGFCTATTSSIFSLMKKLRQSH